MGILLGTQRALLDGRKLINALLFNATTTRVNCGSNAGLDDLHDAAMTAETWVRADGAHEGGSGIIITKGDGSAGWRIYSDGQLRVVVDIECATTDALSWSTNGSLPLDGRWHHIMATWDDASYNYARIWIDGVEDTAGGVTRNGPVLTDAAADLILGAYSTGAFTWNGAHGWHRISDSIRYTGTFIPPSRTNPPAVDANTIAQYNFQEGRGTTLDNAEGTAARDGIITNGTWITVPI